jgi:phosphonate transport system substrate-binding protein
MIVLFALLLSVLLAFGRDIKVGFTAVITREDVKTIKDFLDYLSRKTGYSFSPVLPGPTMKWIFIFSTERWI